MNNNVFCAHFKKDLPGLDKAPIGGPLGELILKHVSEAAWQEWVEAQIKIINEERLDLSEEVAQERLYHQMITFLGLEEIIK
jgi:Fe-S cluster biosynthesis and repair protein YggX